MKKTAFFRGSTLLVVYLLLESFAFGAGKYLAAKGVLYKPAQIPQEAFKQYLENRDSVLGWPFPSSFGTGDLDKKGARVSPGFDPAQKPCVSAYGDSFTWGSEVTADQTWPHLLASKINCPVTNYGVGGYGSDMAYLRFLSHQGDPSKIAILAHTAENILRNVTQSVTFLYPKFALGFKPRYILTADGKLTFVPMPKISRSEYANVMQSPEDFFLFETFLPGSKYGAPHLKYSYLRAVLKSLSHFHVKAHLEQKPWYEEFYDPSHPAEALPITQLILEQFTRNARDRQQDPLVVIIPTELDLNYFLTNGVWVFEPLLKRLQQNQIPVLNVGPALLEGLIDRPVEELLMPQTHYNEEGNSLIAAAVARKIESL